ncbi:hypothetical protein [Alkaliflexus imshenetskii]|uniref:hypothetical protein n=1 Tax=Alkaliflexus imshenetskii TaxID=286730 RepID=UPI00047EA99C|nr:hypothetical protein [Alkaliflexus imshenetskii]
MEKEALLKIILQDIKELETLVNTFTGKELIPDVFMQLARSKTQGILSEIDLLDQLEKHVFSRVNEPVTPIQAFVSAPFPAPPVSEIPVTATSVPEPQPRIAEPLPPPPVKEEPILTIDEEPVVAVKASPTPTVKEPVKTESSQDNGRNQAILGDVLGKNKHSFNELLAQKKDSDNIPKFHKPIEDLRKAIGINDRFLYQRELFGGNADLFNQTIEQLNTMNNFDSAEGFLLGNFNWDHNNQAVVAFKELVKRRFIK